jgi:hypothetical protein
VIEKFGLYDAGSPTVPSFLPVRSYHVNCEIAALTILHVHGTVDAEDHVRRVREWALSTLGGLARLSSRRPAVG